MRVDDKVIIVGGGVAGLALGVALAQAGVRSEIYEREPELSVAGAGLLIQTGAMQALARIGLAERVREVSEEIHFGLADTADGRLLNRTDLGFLRDEFGQPFVALHRARLQRVLCDALQGAPIFAGKRCVGYDEDANGVSARFEDGSTARGTLLIGADGLKSRVRAQLLGDAPPRYAGYSSYRGVTSLLAGVTRHELIETWGRGQRFGVVPLGENELYWFAVFNAPEGERAADDREFLRERFAKFRAPIPDLIEATATDRLLRTDIHDRVPVRSWTKGRVALLGDAAHPTTPNLGQGACMAIEDAVVLAHHLKQAPDLPSALAAYEAARVPFTTRIVHASWQFGRIGSWKNGVATGLRDLLLRATPESQIKKQLRANSQFSVT